VVTGRLASGNQIAYAIYQESDWEDMVRLLGEAFATRDPPAVAVRLTQSEFERFVRLLCGNAATEGLTIVGRSVETGEMIGALLAEDASSAAAPGMEGLSAKFHPIFDILGHLEAAYRGSQAITAGESLHLFLLGVAERFGGRGIGRELVAQCTANGAHKGYRMAVTEATNRTSQHIFRNAGFVERVRGSYRDHRFDGQAVFASIAEHGGPILMDKRLAT
jgi:ribosomal protein S18 acetylase RimI-like enzyme